MSEKHELLVELLRDVHRDLGKYFKDVLAVYDITVPMLLISGRIKSQPGITISELARQTGIAKSHVSNIIRDMENRGWVARLADEKDQRVQHLHLNNLAREKFSLVATQIRAQLHMLVEDIPEEQASALVDGLRDIKSALERSRAGE